MAQNLLSAAAVIGALSVKYKLTRERTVYCTEQVFFILQWYSCLLVVHQGYKFLHLKVKFNIKKLCTVNDLNFQNLFTLFTKYGFRTGIHKMFVRLVNMENPDQTRSTC